MMRIGLATRADLPMRVKVAKHVYDYLKDKCELQVQSQVAALVGGAAHERDLEKMDVDVLIIVGGDGTILHALHHNDAPVFGINMGELGFLTEAEPIELPDALDRILQGDYYVEERLKLAVKVSGERLPDATNEVVLKTARPSKMLHFCVNVRDMEIARVRADGMIVGTPTGSTSYAMSAGGPIVDPRVEAMLVVPIAPFSLRSRPMVLPTSTGLEVHLLDKSKEAVLVIDGQYERAIGKDDVLTVTGSDRKARFIRFSDHFYRKLRERFGSLP